MLSQSTWAVTDFFTYKDGAPIEFDPDYGPEYAQQYALRLARLAHDVAQLLKTLQATGSHHDGMTSNEHSAPEKPPVYLAECSYDRKPARELVEGELKRLGYLVLPDKCLPTDE